MNHKQSSLFAFMAIPICLGVNGCEHAILPTAGSKPASPAELGELEPHQLIIGKWNWIYAIIMQRSLPPPKNRFTPDSAGYTMQHEFMEKGRVNFYRDGQLTGTHSYEIKRFKVLPTDEGTVTEIFIDGWPAQLRFFHPDTMMIGNGWLDGIDYYYARTK